MIGDVFDLAAAYAEAIARGHCFNDGNKRTAFETMVVALEMNGVAVALGVPKDRPARSLHWQQVALEAEALAGWLRG